MGGEETEEEAEAEAEVDAGAGTDAPPAGAAAASGSFFSPVSAAVVAVGCPILCGWVVGGEDMVRRSITKPSSLALVLAVK